MTKLKNTNATTDWYGLDKNGRQIQISHQKLMDWAFNNDLQITVGWSHYFEFPKNHKGNLAGARLVRGTSIKNAAEVAKKQGWDDIYDELSTFAESI